MNHQPISMVCYCEKCTAFGKKGPCNFDKYRENMEKRQPTLLEINERIPISKQDYLHLLYRVEELERKVARLEAEKEGQRPYTQVIHDHGSFISVERVYAEEDPFREFPPLTPEQVATYGSISSNTANNMSAASAMASSFIEKFNKQQ